ncbi:MAG: ATP-binding protein [Acidimicrobiia bacterium]|nr:ATP-binding protein [Acidimicrobiia bacterium]
MSDFDLRSVSLFEHLPEGPLEMLSQSLIECGLARGETLFDEGDVGDKAYIVTSGELEILKEAAGRQVRIAVSGEGVIVGEMALLTAEPRNATARALSDASLVAIPKEAFDSVLASSVEATRALFDVFLQRWREQEDRLRQSERMAQIGVLTAGLAHEMNNPAAAVTRGANELHAAIERYVMAAKAIPADVTLPFRLAERERPRLSGMIRADREEALEDALAVLGVSDPWKYSASLVEAGVVVDDLATFPADHASLVVEIMAAEADVYSLLAEINEGSKRLSELVGALKSYSFLDQAPIQEVDVSRGIEDTLLILRSKTKDIEIERDYQDDLPAITAYGSQLNQVWTNLIDNASDSLRDSATEDPRISIRAVEVGDCIVVTIHDNGPGIPVEMQDRIFEKFYTTKEPGKGTGLGLDTVYSIVVNQHRGAIEVDSVPGSTTFTVKIPKNQNTTVV